MFGYLQEVSDMLGGRISNHDEDEVEDELEALAQEVAGVKLPDAPAEHSWAARTAQMKPTYLPETPDGELDLVSSQAERAKNRAKARRETNSQAPEQILA